jgi:hypothetical protein
VRTLTLLAALFASFATSAHAVAVIDDNAAAKGRRRVAAVRTAEAIVVDGTLDERAWTQAQPATGFSQQQPDEGSPSSEDSEVRFLYDDTTLYVGGLFHDRDVEHGLVVNELKRDFAPRDGDVVAVVLDTFLDRRNAFTFVTNPGGALSDSQAHDDGRQNNQDWNGIWSVRTGRNPGGWTMEMAIPFKTLRFPNRDVQVWGLNLLRVIRRRNEVAVWSTVPRQFTERKVSYAGLLEGIAGVRPGRNLRVKPSVTATAQHAGAGAGLESRMMARGDGGLDVKYGRGGLTADLTWRTDFAQVEADEQQINLSRVSLFFPEKREFFLENQGAFRVGDQQGAHTLVPFFSRRIGLSQNGAPIPVRFGGRLTGKQGPYGVGVLMMSTDAVEPGAPGQHYVAARVSREIGRGHSIGASYFGRESGADINRVGGLDVHLNLRRTLDVDAFVLHSASGLTPTLSSPDSAQASSGRQAGRGSALAGRAALSLNEARHSTTVAYTNVGGAFRNDLGFAAREDAATLTWEHEWNFRPRATQRWLRGFTVGSEGELVDDSAHTRPISRLTRHDYSLEFPDGGRFGVDLDWTEELLTDSFEIGPDVALAPGRYRYSHAVTSYRSDRSRWLSGSLELSTGDFWSGRLTGFEATSRVRVNEHLAVSGSLERNYVDLPEGAFDTTLARLRIDTSFSTRMFLNALVQYNSARRAWQTNVRFNLVHRPLSDIFIVVNETRPATGPSTRSVAVKYTQAVSF